MMPVKKIGGYRVHLIWALVLGILALVFLILGITWLFGSTSAPRVDSVPTYISQNNEDVLKNKRTMQTTHITFDEFGHMKSETHTETTGIDAEAERAMGALGGLGIMQAIGEMMRPRDPIEEMLEDLVRMSAAEQALMNRGGRGGPPGFIMPGVQMIMIPAGGPEENVPPGHE